MNVKRRHLDVLVLRRQENIPMPSDYVIVGGQVLPVGLLGYANGRACDMAQGPCSCGAWHRFDDWSFDTRVEIRTLLKRR